MPRYTVPAGYEPTEKEEYMNANMRAFFWHRLEDWKKELLAESQETLKHLHDDIGGMQEPDIADRASAETDVGLELRTRDRYRKLINKIESAQKRVDDGSYGYCEETNEPIGIKRLIARPVATLSIEAQERHERLEKTQRDD